MAQYRIGRHRDGAVQSGVAGTQTLEADMEQAAAPAFAAFRRAPANFVAGAGETDGQGSRLAGNERLRGLFFDAYMPRVSVVIPALNEEENLRHVLPAIPEWVYEVVLVDGHSVDRSVAVARELLPAVRIVHQQGRGKGNALRAGFAAAEGDIIVMLDADGSTDPREMPAFVGALLAGADYAKGSRFMQGGGTADMTFIRRMGNAGLVTLVRLAFGCNYSDLCYGYNAFWSHVLPRLNLDADGFEIETLMNVRALRARLHVVEVHSFEAPRISGESRLRAIPDGFRVLRTIVSERLGLRPRKQSAHARRRPGRATRGLLAQVSSWLAGTLLGE